MRGGSANRIAPLASATALAVLALVAPARGEEPSLPVAGAFVYPIGDELDYTKPASSGHSGFHISDPYLAVRAGRGRHGSRVHYGVDLSNGTAGETVRAIASGIVEVSDGNAMVKSRTPQRVKITKLVKGKRRTRWGTRYRTTYTWRTGWGNRVVIRHVLPNARLVYSLYAHLLPHSVVVKVGDLVAAGQPIARVGRTGRATAPHLHLEIRTARVEEPSEDEESEGDPESGEMDSAEPILPNTVDPLAFLESHVVRFRDLTPGTWEARYAMAAFKDGVMESGRGRFEPDEAVTREEFYSALVAAFHLETPFTKRNYETDLDALNDAGILDKATMGDQARGDRMHRSEALELVLRCLDRHPARGLSMAALAADDLARDFNRAFAGVAAAAKADRDARKLATDETAKLRKEALLSEAKRAKAARAAGRRYRAKRAKITPVEAVPTLDPGFESLSKSEESLSRAETCLLLASALRIGPSKLSALERAAAKVASSGGSG